MDTITQSIRTHDGRQKLSPDEILRNTVASVVTQWWISRMYIGGTQARLYFRANPDDRKLFERALKTGILGQLPATVDVQYRLSIVNGTREASSHLLRAVRIAGLKAVTWEPRSAMWVNGDAYDGYRVIARSARDFSERQVFPRL